MQLGATVQAPLCGGCPDCVPWGGDTNIVPLSGTLKREQRPDFSASVGKAPGKNSDWSSFCHVISARPITVGRKTEYPGRLGHVTTT